MALKFWQVSEASQGPKAQWLVLDSGTKAPRVAVVRGVSRTTIDKLGSSASFDSVVSQYDGQRVDESQVLGYLDLLRIGIIPPGGKGHHHRPERRAAAKGAKKTGSTKAAAKKAPATRKGTRTRK